MSVSYNELTLREKKITWALSHAHGVMVVEYPATANYTKTELMPEADLSEDGRTCAVTFSNEELDLTVHYVVRINESNEECNCGHTVYTTNLVMMEE